MNIGKNLRDLRVNLRLTQAQLAKLVKVDRKTISRIENESHNINLELFLRILEKLEISPKDFFDLYY